MSEPKRMLDRRSFMKESAVASATFAAALESFHAQQAMAAEAPKKVGRPINLAIIGSGNMGQGDLAQALREPGMMLKAVCDIWPPNAETALEIARGESKNKYFKDLYKGFRTGKDADDAVKAAKEAKVHKDYREMLDKEKDVEAVLIATPLHTHCQIASACIKAGKHVYSEKMMAKTVEECKSLGKLAKDSDKVVQFGHQQHWNDWYKLGYKLIHNDKVCGKMTHIRAWWNRNRSWLRGVSDDEKKLIDASKYGYKDVNELRNWRLFWSTSGGLMAELACHQIDVGNWYTNSMPCAVVGIGGLDFRKEDWGGDVFDNVQVVFEYPSGLKLTYQSITTNSYDGQGEQYMGNEGTVILSRKGGFVFREPSAPKLPWQKHAAEAKDAKGKTGIAMKTHSTVTEGGAKKQEGKGLGDGKKGKTDPYHDYRLALGDWANCIRENKKTKAGWEVALRAAIPCIMANEAMKKKEYLEIKPEMYQV